MTELISFFGDENLKNKYVERLEAHARADNIIQGTGWEKGKGCAVGCTLENYDHSQFEKELGIPEWLARLEDVIFEGLDNQNAKSFPVNLLKGIPVGKTFEKIKYQFAIFLLDENSKRVQELKISEELKTQVLQAIKLCRDVNFEAEQTGNWDQSAAWSAGLAASSAAWSAAWSAVKSAEESAWSAESAAWSAESAASSAVWSVAESAAESASSAARSAARSAAESAWSAARSAEYLKYAEKLIELLREV